MAGHPGAFIAFLLLTPCLTLGAQDQASIPQPGARLRLTYPCEPPGPSPAGESRPGCRSEGRLVLLQGATITLAEAGSTTSYDAGVISRVEVSQGFRSRWLPGAAAGLLVGGGVAFALLNTGGSTSPCDQAANQDALSSGECIGLVALGGLAGAGLGALIGGRFHTERWQDVPLDRLRVRLRSQAGNRPGLAVVVAF